MKTLTMQQGSPEWLAHRRTTRNASEAPAIMGESPHVSRAALIRQRATGIEREIDGATQARFDRGHEVEPALRALAESIIGEDLYPVTGVSDDGYLGASFDGVTLDESIIFEGKQHNAEKRASIYRGEIPPADYWQVVQQFAVCESATQCLYLCGDGTEANTAQLWIYRTDIQHAIPKLIASWQQFDADVAAYVPEPEAAPKPTGKAPDSLPALSIQVTGMVTASNLDDFRAGAMAVLGSINRDLQTDEDFANAEQTVKWCKGVEDRLEATKQQVLGQTADIDAVFRTMDEVGAETRRIRLELEKLVTREKENRRLAIVTAGRTAYDQHVESLKAETKGVWLPIAAPDFASAIKGKKSLSSMADAINVELANAKIAVNQWAAHIRAALACLSEETAEYEHLFPDRLAFISKPVEDIRALVRGRIAEHKQREQERLDQERERIRKEEAERLERERAAAELAEAQASPEGAELSPPAQALNEAQGAARFAERHPSAAPAKAAPPIKLGQINDWLAPLSISADGLASLGFHPAQSKGAAKLYAASDFPRICAALAKVVADAPARAAEKEAA